MLMLVKKKYYILYLAGDMALYLLQKVARGDFHYWVPIDGAFGLIVSLGARVVVKTITDFTGLVHFRGPQELGGLYWTLNIFLVLAASFVSVWVGGGGRMEWTLVLAASGAWVLTFGLSVLLMKKEYRGTFVGTQTGKKQIMERFSQAVDDSVRSSVMKKNKKQWAGIREDVKAWVQANWWRWEEEKPKWMTVSWLAKVPPDMIPEAAPAARRIRASARRRNSFATGMEAKDEDKRRVRPVSN